MKTGAILLAFSFLAAGLVSCSGVGAPGRTAQARAETIAAMPIDRDELIHILDLAGVPSERTGGSVRHMHQIFRESWTLSDGTMVTGEDDSEESVGPIRRGPIDAFMTLNLASVQYPPRASFHTIWITSHRGKTLYNSTDQFHPEQRELLERLMRESEELLHLR